MYYFSEMLNYDIFIKRSEVLCLCDDIFCCAGSKQSVPWSLTHINELQLMGCTVALQLGSIPLFLIWTMDA